MPLASPIPKCLPARSDDMTPPCGNSTPAAQHHYNKASTINPAQSPVFAGASCNESPLCYQAHLTSCDGNNECSKFTVIDQFLQPQQPQTSSLFTLGDNPTRIINIPSSFNKLIQESSSVELIKVAQFDEDTKRSDNLQERNLRDTAEVKFIPMFQNHTQQMQCLKKRKVEAFLDDSSITMQRFTQDCSIILASGRTRQQSTEHKQNLPVTSTTPIASKPCSVVEDTQVIVPPPETVQTFREGSL